MKINLFLAMALAGTVLAGPARAEDHVVALTGLNQEKLGTVTMTPVPEGLKLVVEVSGLSEGAHGFHIHEIGDCSDHAAGFKAAGAHDRMEGQTHGEHSDQGPHRGDLPNVVADATGKARAEFVTGVKLEELQDEDGSAFMLHEKPDDYKTDPSGNSGDRLACGVIAPNGKEAVE